MAVAGSTLAGYETMTENELLTAAQQGNNDAFAQLVRPLQRQLHVHCYRMLGSVDDADDALQEALVRAWRQIGQFEPRAPFRAWLYRIATNVCLTHLERRARRGENDATRWPALPNPTTRQEDDAVRLDPYPDHLLGELGSAMPGPDVVIERAESVKLAFVASIQFLPPKQRATLLLRDVLGYSASEVAAMLTTSVAGINSALQRGRATLERERLAGRVTRDHRPPDAAVEHAVVRRLVDAWHAADIGSIVAALTDDALLTMPPQPERYVGREAIAAFLTTVPAGGRLERFRLVPTRANGQPAVAVYQQYDDAGDFLPHGVMVIALDGELIASMVRFAGPGLFERFGLPPLLGADTVPIRPTA